ncbi:MAG: rhomboid family intramembrane serine protease [Rhizobiales bacterium]|nr:rhomboid family intramembrane serine protease [Hyphomicrobiales bacterium]
MFVPLHDDTPLRVIRFQYMTGALIIANIVLFLTTDAFRGEATFAMIAAGYGLVPAELTSGVILPGYHPVPEPLTLITYMFLHAGWLHLISNMLFLWVFADNVEDAFGHWGFLVFYLICGMAGALAHTALHPSSHAPMIGASAAVSGILGAYIVLFPKARVWVLLLMRIPLRISALWVLGGWFLFQIVSLLIAGEDDTEVAWWAHIGGFVVGVGLTYLLRSRLLIGPAR